MIQPIPMRFCEPTISPKDFEESLYEKTETGLFLKKKEPDLYLSILWNGYHWIEGRQKLEEVQHNFKNSLDILIHGLLLYRKIVIPTNDFLILEPLVRFLGITRLQQLIEQNRLSFIRVKGFLAYVGDSILGGYRGSNEYSCMKGTKDCIQDVNKTYKLNLTKTIINKISDNTQKIDVKNICWSVHQYTLNDLMLDASQAIEIPTHYPDKMLMPLMPADSSIPMEMFMLGSSNSKKEDIKLQKIITFANANLEAILCDYAHCSSIFNDAQLDNHLRHKITDKKLNAEDNHNRLKEFLMEHNASLLTLKHMALREDPEKLDALLKLLLCNDAEILRQEFQALLLKPEDLSTYDLELAYKELITKDSRLSNLLKYPKFICSKLKPLLPLASVFGSPWDIIANTAIPIAAENLPQWVEQKKANPQRLIRKIQSLTD